MTLMFFVGRNVYYIYNKLEMVKSLSETLNVFFYRIVRFINGIVSLIAYMELDIYGVVFTLRRKLERVFTHYDYMTVECLFYHIYTIYSYHT